MRKNFMQLGRSMVEMLGVLAIIGILSIVGIAGYKKAINKYRANELMNLATMLYHQAQAKAMMASPNVVLNSGTERRPYRLFLRSVPANADTSDLAGMSVGMDAPSFITHDRFNIYVDLVPAASKTYAEQTVSAIYFYGMNGNCDLCTALKSFTQKAGTYRKLYGINSALSYIQVYCYPGTEDSKTGTSCWQSSDPD